MPRPRAHTPLGEALLAALPPKRRDLTTAELKALLRIYEEAGKAAVRARTGTMGHAAAASLTAKRILAAARDRLAELSRPAPGGAIYARRWLPVVGAIRSHRNLLDSFREVVGYGPGFRWRDGIQTAELCINVYVRSKHSPGRLRRDGDLPLPRVLPWRGLEIPVDVVEFGELRRFRRSGGTIGPAGRSREGTLGVFARDNGTGEFVALTAMHVTGLQGDYPPGTPLQMNAPADGRRLGRLIEGTDVGLDAAKVSVDHPQTGSFEIEGIGLVHGWRPVSVEGDGGTAVSMFGAVSGLVAGRIERPAMDLPAERLSSAILVRIASDGGDSGAALVDNNNLVLGLLVGEATKLNSVRIFSPIGPVLKRLHCDIPPD